MKVALLSEWHVHAKEYAEQLMAMDDVEVTVVWDNDTKRGQKWADSLNLPFEADLDKVLASDIDGVMITTQTNLHKEVMIKCARAKKHIFTEKVLAFTQEEAKEIIKEIQDNDIIFTISFIRKTLGPILKVKELVDNGIVGDITYGRMRFCHSGASDGWLPETFFDKETCGGGALMDLGAHHMYILPWIIGEPKRMTALMTNVTNKEVEDNVCALIEFANKAIGVVEVSFVSKNPQTIVEFSGTKGSAIANITHNFVEYCTGNTGKWERIETFQPLDTPLRQWVRSVKYGDEVKYGVEDALNLTKMMENCYEAFNNNKIIDIK